MHGKCEFFAELRRVSNIFVKDLSEKTVLCDFRDSGIYTKKFNSLFFAFSVLSTVWLAEIDVFLKILRK